MTGTFSIPGENPPDVAPLTFKFGSPTEAITPTTIAPTFKFPPSTTIPKKSTPASIFSTKDPQPAPTSIFTTFKFESSASIFSTKKPEPILSKAPSTLKLGGSTTNPQRGTPTSLFGTQNPQPPQVAKKTRNFEFQKSPVTAIPAADSASPTSDSSSFMSSSEEEEQAPSIVLPTRQKGQSVRAAPTLREPTLEEYEALTLKAHLALLQTGTQSRDQQEVTGTPLFTNPVKQHSPNQFTQYGFIAGLSEVLDLLENSDSITSTNPPDPRLFFNIAAPSSAFICGSQGSGKSHTLSCLLENCLMRSNVSKLEHPLSALVFHYDTFASDDRGTPCEAAFLASNPAIQVRVLCSPTNLRTIQRTYEGLNVKIQPLEIDESNLNTKRMLDLMAVNQDDGAMPLYLHKITQILKSLRLIQQRTDGPFNYVAFKQEVENSDMTPFQKTPLSQRLDSLESFMPKWQTDIKLRNKGRKGKVGGTDWTVKPGQLTIVDLSCPCVTSEGACSLFNMCLSLYLGQNTKVGRVVALDEAHKYMNNTSEADNLTATLLSSIRLQRHLGTRVFISTQEPTISPALLDLCSITIVHRFISPDWLQCLRSHLAALSDDGTNHNQSARAIFAQIVKLRVGEALLFAPSALTGVVEKELVRLGTGYLKIKMRARITADGGQSIMAN